MSNTFAVPLQNTRNVTIVAHVDHGKTSFADSLLSSNNIISSRMAGKLRFLDSREDEQERGITMESSAVSLRFDMTRLSPDGTSSIQQCICNVIDTPGHVDFASEVSTASRLCDGALVLVDVWEGVATQTIAVLRQAWMDKLKPLLVINKMDRLITELKLSPSEAYHHISQLIEQVNAVMGSFYASERMEDDLRWREEREKRLAARKEQQGEDLDDDEEYEEKEDEDIYFAPDRGNVLFASAIDGWAFRLGKFARLYAEKLKIKEGNLRRVLWGDWYLDPKTKRVVGRKKLAGRNLKPMFVQFVLENIWRVYDTVLNEHNPDAVQKIVTALNVRITPRDLRSKDTRNLLNLIMQQWLPLSTATFQSIIEVIPPPPSAQAVRLPYMLHPEKAKTAAASGGLKAENELERGLYECDQGEGAEVVAYVSKMFAVRKGDLPEYKPKEMTAEEMRARGREERERRAALVTERQAKGEGLDGQPLPEDLTKPLESLSLENSESATSEKQAADDSDSEVLLGFSRIFSSTLHRGTSLLAILPKFDPSLPPSHSHNAKYIVPVVASDLYMMMGRELVSVDSVPAGHVCAIGGLNMAVPRSATLWAPDAKGVEEGFGKEALVNLAGVGIGASAIVRVALEPENPSDMPKLIRGLQILNQADPCAEYLVQESGEHVIITAGELHLERCLKDLRERFAKCPIQQSAPIVPFRETAVKAPDMVSPKTAGAPRGTINGTVLNGLVKFRLRAMPLPEGVETFLLSQQGAISKMLVRERGDKEDEEETDVQEGTEGGSAESEGPEGQQEARQLSPEEFWTELERLLNKAGGDWVGAADRVWSFGPKRVGANLLLDPVGTKHLRLRRREQLFTQARAQGQSADDALLSTDHAVAADQLASLSSTTSSDNEAARAELRLLRDYESSIETGFQLSTFQGPLCAEPVVGMAWVVENVELDKQGMESEQGKGQVVGGALISAVRDACRQGLLDWSPRIKLAMYTCDIQASTDVLGKVYGVVARRRGRIVSEEMKEGTSFFTIRSMLPVVESFGFADEIRTRTSGAASPQLIFSGYETLDLDPFWVPTTQEELEDLGEKADKANVAKAYVDGVRKRKGMFVERKIVEFAEKQRTLKK
ncbi:ribosome assembly protein 1 [Cryptococcus neoformans Tu401-1]|nr:ribosome assembly protein 1 [Cryptococcus neoformans var. grubii Tu401-1]